MSGITLDALEDIAIISTGGNELLIDASGHITANINGSVTVTATDLDIRDLVNTQDSVAIGDEATLVDMAIMDSAFGITSAGFPIMGIRQDAAGSPVSADGDAHPLVFNDDGELKVAADLTSSVADDAADSGNPIKVGGRGVSTASALGALSAANDRFDLLGDLYRRLFTNDSNNIGWKVEPHTIGATETEVAATPLGGRKEVIIQNTSTNSVWVGEVTGVTTSGATRGIEIPKKSSMMFKFGEALNLFVISDGAGREINVLEAA